MHLFLVFVMFGFFLGLDYILSRRRAARESESPATIPVPAVAEPVPAALPRPEPVWVAGYQLPSELHYHRGHTWARLQDAETVVVGLDEFSRKLVGKPENVKIPSVGAWQRQGEAGFRVRAQDGREASFVAPIEGDVIAVNRDVKKDASLLDTDPYGRGWLYKIRPSNLAANLRNLLSGSLAQRWTEDARDELELRLMALSGSVLQDGGEPSPDFADHLEDEDWVDLVEHFLMTRAHHA